MNLESTGMDWLIVVGLGALWHGGQIMLVGRFPRALQRGEVATAETGSERAFMLFWLDQYSYMGLILAVAGLLVASAGALG